MPAPVSNHIQKRPDILQYLRAPERVTLAKILSLAVSVVFALFILDAAVFRTHLYGRFLEPSSYLGDFETSLRIGRETPFKKPHHALVLGDSQIGEGFSSRVADEAGADAGWEFVNVAVGGAAMRSLYYLDRDVDPDRNRFDAVVLPLHGYPDVDDGEVRADRELDLRWMIARLRLSDIPDFAASFPTRSVRMDVIRESLFEGLVYRRDFRELLRHYAKRMRDIEACRAACAESSYAYSGRTEDLSGLWMDWATNTIHYPPGASEQVQYEMKLHTNFRDWSVRGIEGAYRKAWLGRIIDRYRGTRTRIVIVPLPYRPFPIPLSWPIDSNSFIVQASKNPGVAIVDEHLFDDLQRPELFFDVFHLNKKGRDLYSSRLAAAIIQRVEGGAR